MSSQARLLKRPGSELCAECHESVVGAATAETGHPPAAEDCVNCHAPHSSAERSLLTAPAEEICGICHDRDDSDLSEKHLGADLNRVECLSCHTPHGSGNDSLLAQNLHAPILDGCDTCHEGSWNQVAENGESSLCLICHEDIGEASEEAATPHPAMEIARCADCHNPHASAQDKLVKAPRGEVCTQCHDDQAAAEGEVNHEVIALIGCQACHEPHGGEGETMLREQGNLLCLSCHSRDLLNTASSDSDLTLLGRFKVSRTQAEAMASLRLSADGQVGHPLSDHRVSGTPTPEELERATVTYEGDLTCLTCHDPHKGRSRLILQWGAASSMEACMHCHPK
jgi:predicted CXXCH cytochrome family protein